MSDRIYYLAKDWDNCEQVVKNDKQRDIFLKRLKNDEHFRTVTLRWTKKSVDEYVKSYKARAKCPGMFLKEKGSYNKKTKERKFQTCTMYKLGHLVKKSSDGKTYTVRMENGKNKDFPKTDVCQYDESHDAEEIPDDVCAVKGFGKAALLKTMRRRLVEKLTIYTYVGDVILCLNPYMGIPAMVDIAEPPAVKQYKLGTDPSSYASAHFAYYGQFKPDDYPSQQNRDQSCIVSGESGAGKTVSCGLIMTYLARLSNWRKQELGEFDEEEDGDSKEEEGGSSKKNITKLVAGVSPFLEAFGNAKTNMNDNSSRFGKFTKIWMDDGKIIGAELEHYLLEKARITGQGKGERNFHIFYFLIRGGTAEEKKEFFLDDCDKYPKLCEGGSSQIGHGHGPEYDVERMNNPLDEEPDDTGTRAALTAAQVKPSKQHQLWKAVAAVINMSKIEFKKKGAAGSEVKNLPWAKKCASLLGLGKQAEKFCKFLTIQRLLIPGGHADKDCTPKVAGDNCNSLAKDVYDKSFTWLIEDVCNGVLQPEHEGDAFVGLLDIFGFEVMPKNSIEQLCINFANEKLQWLFNEHVFDDEKTTYLNEGLSTDVIPPHNDTTPCCNLVVGMGTSKKARMKLTGILPLLDDKKSQAATNEADAKFVQELCSLYGKKKKKAGEMYKKAKTKHMKLASQYFYGDRKHDHMFTIRHYAGDIEYNAKEFLHKNVDKLPVQLVNIMKSTEDHFLRSLYDPTFKDPDEKDDDDGDDKKKKKKRKKFDTLASNYIDQLKRLATTLKKTTPHYVRCVKPNDIKYRPVDGVAAFDDWKSYRQLLYAGVMEVVKIKKEGFPYREPYEKFWERAVQKGYCKLLGMDPDMDATDGTIELAEKILPKPHDVKRDGETLTLHYWAKGNTLFFAKDDTPEILAQWHQRQLAGVIQGWWRISNFNSRWSEFKNAVRVLTTNYRVILMKRKFAKYTGPMIRVQAMIRSIEQFRNYDLRKRQRIAAKRFLKAWHNYHEALSYGVVYNEYVHFKATQDLAEMSTKIVDQAKQRLAGLYVLKKIKTKLWNLRRIFRIQEHLRRCIAERDFRSLQKAYYLRLAAAAKAAGQFNGTSERVQYIKITNALGKIQPLIRRHILKKQLKTKRVAARVITRFGKMCGPRVRFLRRKYSAKQIQHTTRWIYLRESYYREIGAATKLQEWWREFFKIELRDRWIHSMIDAASRADLHAIDSLMRREGHYHWIQNEHLMILLNQRDERSGLSVMHAAVRSGSFDTVRLLLANGAFPFWRDSSGETPIHISARFGDSNLPITKVLLSRCPHRVKALNIVSKQGHTVLDALFEENKDNLNITFDTVMWLMNNGAESASGIDVVHEIKQEVLRKQHAKAARAKQEQRLNSMRDNMLKNDALLQLTMKHLTDNVDPITLRQQKQSKDAASTVIQKYVRGWMARTIPDIVRWHLYRVRSKVYEEESKTGNYGGVRKWDTLHGSPPGLAEALSSTPLSTNSRRKIPTHHRSNKYRKFESLMPETDDDHKHDDDNVMIMSSGGTDRHPEVTRLHRKIRARLTQYHTKLGKFKNERDALKNRLSALRMQLLDMSGVKSSGEDSGGVKSTDNVMSAIERRLKQDRTDKQKSLQPPGTTDDMGEDMEAKMGGVPTLWGPSSMNDIVRKVERPISGRITNPSSFVKLSPLHSSLLAMLQVFETLHDEATETPGKGEAYGWFYLDARGSEHGPFQLGRLMRWNRQRRLRDTDGIRLGPGKLNHFIPMECVRIVASNLHRGTPTQIEKAYIRTAFKQAKQAIQRRLIEETRRKDVMSRSNFVLDK